MSEADVTLAVSLDDMSLMELVFHTERPQREGKPETRLSLGVPSCSYEYADGGQRKIMHATVSVLFGLAFPLGGVGEAPDASNPSGFQEFLSFSLTSGVTTSVQIAGKAALGRHMAGSPEDQERQREEKLERVLLLEGMKSVYGLANSKLLEMSSSSPLGKVLLPPVDADTLLSELAVQQTGKSA